MQVNIFQNISWKVAVTSHFPVICGSSWGNVTLLYIHKSRCNNLDDHYDDILVITTMGYYLAVWKWSFKAWYVILSWHMQKWWHQVRRVPAGQKFRSWVMHNRKRAFTYEGSQYNHILMMSKRKQKNVSQISLFPKIDMKSLRIRKFLFNKAVPLMKISA